ncbi:hypothetical protein Tsubulata_008540 [Turnera subulata]|uniref:Uncharacterized protein n=1 Tax=Turnera subulata TaxID=218843 RepID=A0A9Q0J330_9ROSI|nr:hypothetical protein Tsubulata_008540 [Turnera subulata]
MLLSSPSSLLVRHHRLLYRRPRIRIIRAAAAAASIRSFSLYTPSSLAPWPPPESIKYEGNLIDGIVMPNCRFPKTWSLDDEEEREMIYWQFGTWVPPTDADIDRFFHEIPPSDYGDRAGGFPSLRRLCTPRYRQYLIPYFRQMRKSWGFEVPFLPTYSRLEYSIIKPVLEDIGCTDHDFMRLPLRKDGYNDRRGQTWLCIITTVQYLDAITGHKHEPVEIKRVNVYHECWDSLYLTFTARNMSTDMSQTFQAVVRLDGSSGDYSCDMHYVRLKPNNTTPS